jgi:hypothetical protein
MQQQHLKRRKQVSNNLLNNEGKKSPSDWSVGWRVLLLDFGGVGVFVRGGVCKVKEIGG